MYSCQTICLAHPTHRNSRVGSSPSPAGTRCAPLSPSSRQQQQSGRCCRARAAAAGRWNTHWGSSAGWLQWTLWQLPAAHPESHSRRCRIAHGQWAGSSYGRTGKPIYRLFFFFAICSHRKCWNHENKHEKIHNDSTAERKGIWALKIDRNAVWYCCQKSSEKSLLCDMKRRIACFSVSFSAHFSA